MLHLWHQQGLLLVRGVLTVTIWSWLLTATVVGANFVGDVPPETLARAERYRVQIAQDWLGEELSPWSKPCILVIQVSEEVREGRTSFKDDQWTITIKAPEQDIGDQVLPHEITHAIIGTALSRKELPFWLKEGIATIQESHTKRVDIEDSLGRGTPLNALSNPDTAELKLEAYQKGLSVVTYLVTVGGKKRLMRWLKKGVDGDLQEELEKEYSFTSWENLDQAWGRWKRAKPPKQIPAKIF
jgi:hypothetical protein